MGWELIAVGVGSLLFGVGVAKDALRAKARPPAEEPPPKKITRIRVPRKYWIAGSQGDCPHAWNYYAGKPGEDPEWVRAKNGDSCGTHRIIQWGEEYVTLEELEKTDA